MYSNICNFFLVREKERGKREKKENETKIVSVVPKISQ